MKKLLCVLLAAIMLLSFAACAAQEAAGKELVALMKAKGIAK